MQFNKFYFAFALFLIAGCSTESEQVFQNPGTVKGTITLTSEFGQREKDQSNAVVTLNDGKNTLQASTDPEGTYTIDKVPAGTYNISLEKSGFSKISYQGIAMAGGTEPYYFSATLPKPSTASVTDLSVTYSPGILSVTGTASLASFYSFYPVAVIFLSASSDVSPQKYIQSYTLYTGYDNSNVISTNIGLDSTIFPKGTKLYAVAYGVSLYYSIYNPETDRFEYPTIGKVPSNIAFLQLPN